MIGEDVGNYRIVGKLGEGGMGVVWAAEHPLLGRKAAIKMLRPELSRDKEYVTRFFHEARTAATLKHPGITPTFDYGTWKDGSAYLIMELLEGESLAARLKRSRPLPLDLAVAVARQVASALGAAHDKGIIHRDLKPDNIFLTPEAEAPLGLRAKVLDFGIAKITDENVASDVKTRTGSILGTPYYMSPEQCLGGSSRVDRRADVYSLGCVLFEMVCGRPPFLGDQLGAIAGAHIYKEPPSPRSLQPDLPEGLDRLILRLLAKEPSGRPDDMAAVAAALPDVPRTTTLPETRKADVADLAFGDTMASLAAQKVTRASPRRRGFLAAGVVTAAAGAAVVAWIALRPPDEGPTPPSGTSSPRQATVSSQSQPIAVHGSGATPRPDAAACDAALRAAAAAMQGDVPYAAFAYRHLARLADHDAERADFVKTCAARYDGDLVACFRGAKAPLDVAGCAAAFEQRRCDAGDPDSCAAAAWGLYEHHDDARAVALAGPACSSSSGSACALLGVSALYGRGGPGDLAAARASLERAAALGDGNGQNYLAHVLRHGLGAPPDLVRARTLYGQACASVPDGPACAGLGVMERLGEGGDHDARAAEKHVAQACDAQVGTGCLYLGDVLAASHRDAAAAYARARALLGAQAEDSASAKYRLAQMQRDGKGGAADPLEAARLLEKACAEHEWLACQELGDLDAGGQVDVNLPAARRAYAAACDGAKLARACDAVACFQLLDQSVKDDRLRDCRKHGYLGPITAPEGTQLHRPATRAPTKLRKQAAPDDMLAPY